VLVGAHNTSQQVNLAQILILWWGIGLPRLLFVITVIVIIIQSVVLIVIVVVAFIVVMVHVDIPIARTGT
jgi:hypothetical protein